MWKEVLETTFGLFYVMTEGEDHDGSAQKTRVSIFLVIIDMGQVLRTITSAQLGWSRQSIEAVSWVDIVFVITEQLEKVIPRLVFFLTAVVLIMGALADTIYVARIFKQGNVRNMLPVRILRFLVGAIVTTLFTTVLEWVLFPTECLLEPADADNANPGHKSLSQLLHGELAPCKPFGTPEIAVTLPTILIAAVYIVYSLITMLLAFEINPLSRNPWAHSTGRGECLWTALKVAAAVLPYLSQFLSSTVVSFALLAMSLFLLWTHLTRMPFHDLSTNVVRGGVYGAVSWLSLSSVIVSSYNKDSDSFFQARQWILLALLPVLFVVVAVVVYQRKLRIVQFVHLLRGEFSARKQQQQGVDDRASFNGHEALGLGCSAWGDLPELHVNEEDLMRKTMFDKFYDLDYELNRAFKTAAAALNVARAVLYSRRKTDLPFLNYLVLRALVENPEDKELLIFQFLVQRFIQHDETQAAHKARLNKLQSLPLALDHRYLLYAVNRRANQEFASAHLGKGAMSAINVMEFEGRMERARKAHLDCVVHMKAFWKAVRRSRRDEAQAIEGATIEDMLQPLGQYEKALWTAQVEYEWLLEKYSGSVSMLTSYANFCDAVLNDILEAQKRRKQAILLEGSPEDEPTGSEADQAKLEQATGSTATSESESARTQAAKYMQSWSHVIMASEVESLKKLTWRVRTLMLTLTVIATAGYAFSDFYLFRDVAKKYIDLIDKTGEFRMLALASSFLLRSQMIAAHTNHTEEVVELQHTLDEWVQKMRVQHKINYESLETSDLKTFYNTESIITVAPVQGSVAWTTELLESNAEMTRARLVMRSFENENSADHADSMWK